MLLKDNLSSEEFFASYFSSLSVVREGLVNSQVSGDHKGLLYKILS